jgi:hypothetical protein
MDLERRRVRLAGWILRRHPPSPSPNSPETAPHANQNDGSDDGCLGGADQITKPDDRPVRDAVEAKVVPSISPAGSWPNVDTLPMAAMNPVQFWMQFAEQWQKAVTFGLTHIRNRAELVSCAKVRAACEAERIADDYQGGCFAANFEDNRDIFQPSRQEHTFSILRRSACAGCACKAN